MSLTGRTLMVVLVLGTVALPIATVVIWQRGPGGVWRMLRNLLAVLVCQAVAVAAAGVLANDTFGFYNSWADLLGTQKQSPQLPTANGLVPGNGADGTVREIAVRQNAAPHTTFRVLVWTPKEYNQPQYSSVRFPVTMMLPGQPGTPEGVFNQFRFGQQATQAIEAHLVKPFVAVFPPIMIAPPRDTECTDVQNGPQSESWLYRDVRHAVLQQFRVARDGHLWSALGWSTGGFCAAKLLLRHPQMFHAAVGLGAYYDAETDRSTGALFGRSVRLRDANSPIWLVRRPIPGRVTRLLIVVSRLDRASYSGRFYADSEQMIQATRGTPGVATLVLNQGGHNYRVYRATLPQSFAWLGRNAGL